MAATSVLPIIPDRPLAPPAVKAGATPDAIARTAKDFEAMVMGELIAPMFEALDSNVLGGGGDGERMFRPMLVQEYAKAIAGGRGIGIADSVMRAMIQMQGGGDGAQS
jgi:Rod binding domain-containing protein